MEIDLELTEGDRVIATRRVDHGIAFEEGETGIVIRVDENDPELPYRVRSDYGKTKTNWFREEEISFYPPECDTHGNLKLYRKSIEDFFCPFCNEG